MSNPGAFPSTSWTLVVMAGKADSPEADAALESLCKDYWYPLYCYARRRGYSQDDAQDLTQGFFERLLARRDLASVDEGKGRFRSFLLASLKHFMADEWDRSQALKRGGGRAIVAFSQLNAEERYQAEPRDEESPEVLFGKSWAQTVLAKILGVLEEEQREAGKADFFEVIRPFVTWSTAVESNYREVTDVLGMNVSTIRVQVFRLRKRYAEILREEIGRTVASTDQVDREIDELFRVLRGDQA